MMKFFRKYTKHLLAVFMALLLVVWLGGSALTSMLQSRGMDADVPRGTAFGEEVQLKDMLPAFNEAQTLDMLIPIWSRPWGGLAIREEPLSVDEWYMLKRAADRSGISVSQEEVSRVRAQIATDAPGRIEAVRKRFGLSLERIDQAIRSFMLVQRIFLQVAGAIKPSEADLQDFVRQVSERVRVSAVALDGSIFEDESYEPTGEEIQAHFDNYKESDPVEGGISEFGYRLPEAVQVEYIRVSVDALAKTQRVSDDEGYTYWKAHPEEFTKPNDTAASQPVSQPASQPSTSSAPASQPKPEPPKPYATFTEAKPKVKEKLERDKAKEAAVRIARELIRQLDKPWKNAPTTEPFTYKQPPESQMGGEVYPKLVEQFETRHGGVLKYARTQLEAKESLVANEEIGSARALAGTVQEISFGDVAFFVAGLEAQREDQPDHVRFFRNVYETVAEPLVDEEGNTYVMRTVAARPKVAPESAEAVREQIIEDLRALHGYRNAKQKAEQLADRAREIGLAKALKENAILEKQLGEDALKEPPPFSRQQVFALGQGRRPQLFPGFVPGFGMDSELVDACFTLAAAKATTQPVKILVHEQAKEGRWVVVEAHEIVSVKQEDYDRQRNVAISYLGSQLMQEFMADWYDPQQIRARVGWEDYVPPESTETKEAKDADKTGASKKTEASQEAVETENTSSEES